MYVFLGEIGLALLVGLGSLMTYRLFLHPLAQYPGPLLARLTGWYSVYHAYVADVHLDMLRCHQKYGPVVRYSPDKIIFNNSAAIKEIYSRSANVQKSTSYRAFQTSPTAQDLQTTVDKTEHARKRRVISQAFSDAAVKSLEQHVVPHADKLVESLSKDDLDIANHDGGDTWTAAKNIAHWCTYVSFDYMTELVFGKALNLLDTEAHHYIIVLINNVTRRTGIALHMPWLATWNFDKYFVPKIRDARIRYHHTSRSMALERMHADSARQDLFSHILAASDPETGEGFTMDDIWGESTLLIVAGSDALSIAMSGCFFYLSRHRSVYEKVRDEIRTTFTSLDEIRHHPKLASCVYLRACIDESMRMSPPVGAALWREVCDGGACINGYQIPAGYDIGIGIYALHHNEEYYPDPFRFRPERWIESDEVSAKSVSAARAAFQAFSTGPAGCVGKNLAYMELSITLARVLWSLEFRLAAKQLEPKPEDAYLRFYKEHDKYEYHLRDRFTSWKDGPMLSFKRRRVDARVTE